ncbi:hypothetical protein AAF712_013865 [Marasmius tenuissimus]|uniref:Yip1 domain-containing protein n=1 Tax=Marasmius tenuissimus TaxID=585030 RepID=A0ABR2ZCJ5_9AGAR
MSSTQQHAATPLTPQSTARRPVLSTMSTLSKCQLERAVLESNDPHLRIPSHWKANQSPTLLGTFRRSLFNLLCIASFGHAGLEPVWASIKSAEQGDDRLRDLSIQTTCDRLNYMIIVATLLLTPAAVFISTEPPRSALVNYTLRGPYGCFLAAFGLLIGSAFICWGCLLIVSKAQLEWSQRVLFSNRIHVYLTLIPLAYPVFSITLATVLLAIGVLSATWSATDREYQGVAVLLLVLPTAVCIIFPINCVTAPPAPPVPPTKPANGNGSGDGDRAMEQTVGTIV